MKNYIRRLIDWKNSQTAALRADNLILSLAKIGQAVGATVESAEAQVAKRIEYIAQIDAQIADARAKMAALAAKKA